MQNLQLRDFISDKRFLPKAKKRKTNKKKCKNGTITTQQVTKRLKDQPFDDFTVECKPTFSIHAQRRLQEGRQGKYICKPSKEKHRMCVVTVLPKKGKGAPDDPSFSNDRSWNTHSIPRVKKNRKYTLYKLCNCLNI